MIPQLYVGPTARAAALTQAAADLGGPPDEHPDARLAIAGSTEVGIDQIRDLILWARYGPVRAARKLAVVGPAEKLSREAANALLKLLEEAPPYLETILFAEALDQVLPTVRSRCALRWCAGTLAQLLATLRAAGYTDKESAFIASLLDDRMEEAAAFLAARRDPLREWQDAESAARALSLGELSARFAFHAADPLRRRAFGRSLAQALCDAAADDVLEAMERLAKDGKETVAAFLDELARFLVAEATTARPGLPVATLLSWAHRASLARGELDDNANPRLLAEVVALWPRRT